MTKPTKGNAADGGAAARPSAKRAPRARPATKQTSAPAPAGAADGLVDGQGRPAIEFRGRTIAVAMPSLEQIDVWNRTGARLQAIREAMQAASTPADRDEANRQAMNLVSRLSRVIHSVMASPDDREWLDDQFLDGVLTYSDAAQIVTAALDRHGVDRQQERAPARLRA
jgi:hypothetical protein